MNERLLQFIWQFQYFNKQQLISDEGENLQIIHAGTFNRNQGPDFLNASIKIDNTVWAGNIELHVKASDWNKHNHTKDPNYRNVILHVVWENDTAISQSSSLSLKERIPKVLLERYEQLMHASFKQACKPFLPALNDIGWTAWKERLMAERLERKSKKVLQLLKESKQHWEEVFWWMLAANFGIKINAETFEIMARSISVNILAKHKNQIHQLEALLLGQANLLNREYEEDYPKMLQKEYRFLAKKYELNSLKVLPHFLRMRPANFPTIRLAQLASLVNQSSHLFSNVKEMKDVASVKKLLNVTANDYWHYHYLFDELTAYKPKHLGSQMVDNLIINTIAPVLFAYGLYSKTEEYKTKAINWLQETSAEQNTITKQWMVMEVGNTSAFDSQSLIELTNNYCNNQKCLECAVGNKILRT
jgi:hypothetical protein